MKKPEQIVTEFRPQISRPRVSFSKGDVLRMSGKRYRITNVEPVNNPGDWPGVRVSGVCLGKDFSRRKK